MTTKHQPSSRADSYAAPPEDPPRSRSDELLRLAISGAALGTWQRDLRSGALTWSKRMFELFGIEPRPDISMELFRSLIDEQDREAVVEAISRSMREGSDSDVEFRVVWPDGSPHWLLAHGRIVRDAAGHPTHMEGVVQDMTALRQFERELRERELRYHQLADAMPHLVWRVNTQGHLTYANRRWVEYFRRTTFQFDEMEQMMHPDDLARARTLWSALPHGDSALEALRLKRHDGQYLWFAVRLVAVHDSEGRFSEVVGSATEVEPLKRAEGALRESRVRLDTALRSAGMGTWIWQLDTDLVQLDGSLAQLLGFPAEPAQRTMQQWLELLHPDDLPAVRLAITRSRDCAADLDVECRVRRAQGDYIWVSAKGRVDAGDAGGKLQLFGACVDVTQHKRLEEELRQAQKMEAIGQLAGGVAHDFNNLLMVIFGHASLISLPGTRPEQVSQAVTEIQAAAERAASLTGQLLAFARRQTMQQRDVDLNALVADVGQMLERLIGENVVLRIAASATVARLRADPTMLIQVLLNLALNARDAMPSGGELTLRVSREALDPGSAEQLPEARPGSWACLTVSDTGEGIAPETLPHIFEPFFTTKPVGQGTGLGLSTVYGIVKQHRGFVSVDSRPGHGATFKVFLPLPEVSTAVTLASAPSQPLGGHKELVLLVEDDAAVRGAMSSLLEQHGYRSLVADDAMQALELFATRGDEIALLLSDAVLPRGLSGADLALQLRQQNPRLQVILCSGYSADKIEQSRHALPGMVFLQKPYRVELLLASMRSLLDQAQTAALTSALG